MLRMALQYSLTGADDAEDDSATRRRGLARARSPAGSERAIGAGFLPAGAAQCVDLLRLAIAVAQARSGDRGSCSGQGAERGVGRVYRSRGAERCLVAMRDPTGSGWRGRAAGGARLMFFPE